jgi:hypothetical protein
MLDKERIDEAQKNVASYQEDALEIIGRKSDELISNFDKELGKRSIFQYETTEEIKMAKAKTSLERAKKFIFEMRKLL